MEMPFSVVPPSKDFNIEQGFCHKLWNVVFFNHQNVTRRELSKQSCTCKYVWDFRVLGNYRVK